MSAENNKNQPFNLEGVEIRGISELDQNILLSLKEARQNSEAPTRIELALKHYNPKDPIDVILGNFNSQLARLRKRLIISNAPISIVSGKRGTLALIRNESSQLPEPEKALVLTHSPEVMTVARKIERVVTASQIEALIGKGISPEEYSRQIITLSEYAERLQKGEIEIIEPLALIGQPTNKKTELACERVRQMIIPMIKPTTTWKDRHELAQQINNLLQVLGTNGVSTFRNAVDGRGDHQGLSDVERGLLFANLSMSMKAKLEYIDLDMCSEKEMAWFIKSSSYRAREVMERDDTLEMLISALIERDEDGSIDLSEVVQLLLNHDNFEIIHDSLRETARYRGLRPELIQIFSSCEETRSLCREIQREIDFDTIDNEHPVAPWRNIDTSPLKRHQDNSH